jgi:transposase InsO family protein
MARSRSGPAGHRNTAAYVPDNGVIERLFRTLKEQILRGGVFRTIEEVRNTIRGFAAHYNAE